MSDNYNNCQEIEALKAIFCGDGEFTELSDFKSSGKQKTFKIQIKLNEDKDDGPVLLMVTFCLLQDYPLSLPEVSLSSTALHRKCLDSLKLKLIEYSQGLRSQPMIMDQVMWLQEHACQYIQPKSLIDTCSKSEDGEEFGWMALCQLDHMRARIKYCKKLSKWGNELNVEGGIFFVKHLIFILLTGRQNNVKEFLKRLKTQNVDVDSHGKSCKERMMKILTEFTAESLDKFNGLEVFEFDDVSKLASKFSSCDLETIYVIYIKPLLQNEKLTSQ